MKYNDFVNDVIADNVYVDNITDMWYIAPDYRYNIAHSDLNINDIEDFDGVTWDIIFDHMSKEVELHNSRLDKTIQVADWFYKVIYDVMENVKTDIQDGYLKDVVEYLKQKNKGIKIKDTNNE